MLYLTKENQPKKITSRQLNGFFKAQKEWLSANGAYNKEHFGIDSLTYKWIQIAVSSLTGICGPRPKLKELNTWFDDAPYLTDDEGRYLTYLGDMVRC